jgi:hypothetical protein
MSHAVLALARQPSLAELDATIARAEWRLARRRLALALRAAAGLDTTRAEAELRRARDRLAALREQRSLSLVCRRRARSWSYG